MVVNVGQFSNIVNVSWSGGDIAFIYGHVAAIFNENTDLTMLPVNIELGLGLFSLDDILNMQVRYPFPPNPAKYPIPPNIEEVITGEMRGAYFAWSYVPYRNLTSAGVADAYVFDVVSFYTALAAIVGDNLSDVLDPTKPASATEEIHWLFLPYIHPPLPFGISSQSAFNDVMRQRFGNGYVPIPGPNNPDPPDLREEMFALFSSINGYFTYQSVARVNYELTGICLLNLSKIRAETYKQRLAAWNGQGEPPSKPETLKFQITSSSESNIMDISTFHGQKSFQVDDTNYPIFDLDLGDPPNQKEIDEVFKDQKRSVNSLFIAVTINYETLEITIDDPLSEIG